MLAMAHLGPKLALREFTVSTNPTDGIFVRIIGRPSGIVGWFLSLIRLLEDTTFEVSEYTVKRSSASLAGRTETVLPIARIASTSCGYTKNLILGGFGGAALFSSIGALVNGETGAFIVALVIAVVFFVLYLFSKSLTLWVESSGGSFAGIRCQSALIQGVRVDFDRVQQVIDLLNIRMSLPSA